MCCIYSQREVVFGMCAWHQRIPVFYPAELLFLVGVAGRFPFLTQKGRGECFPQFITRLRSHCLKEPSKAPWATALVDSIPALFDEGKDTGGCRGGTQQGTVCRLSVWAP